MKAGLICGFIVICCVGYVWQKKQIADLSQQISNADKRRRALHMDNEKLATQLAILVSPPALEARAKEMKLGLGPPQPNQIWRLPVPAAGPSKPGAGPQFMAEKQVMLGMP